MSKDSRLSKITPRFFIDAETVTLVPATVTQLKLLARSRCGFECGLKKMIDSDFEGFRASPFAVSQTNMDFTQLRAKQGVFYAFLPFRLLIIS